VAAGVTYGRPGADRAFGLSAGPTGGLTVATDDSSGYDAGLPAAGTGWYVQSARYGAGTLTQYRDGVALDNRTVAIATRPGRIAIGATLDGVPAAMDVAAVLIYDRALTETERRAVESYLQATYLGVDVPVEATAPADALGDGNLDPDSAAVNGTGTDDDAAIGAQSPAPVPASPVGDTGTAGDPEAVDPDPSTDVVDPDGEPAASPDADPDTNGSSPGTDSDHRPAPDADPGTDSSDAPAEPETDATDGDNVESAPEADDGAALSPGDSSDRDDGAASDDAGPGQSTDEQPAPDSDTQPDPDQSSPAGGSDVDGDETESGGLESPDSSDSAGGVPDVEADADPDTAVDTDTDSERDQNRDDRQSVTYTSNGGVRIEWVTGSTGTDGEPRTDGATEGEHTPTRSPGSTTESEPEQGQVPTGGANAGTDESDAAGGDHEETDGRPEPVQQPSTVTVEWDESASTTEMDQEQE
jgi:hypothetical protein